jgi:soluble lytic murein transglycosylase-like protein
VRRRARGIGASLVTALAALASTPAIVAALQAAGAPIVIAEQSATVRPAAAVPDSSWRTRAARPALLGDSILWVPIADAATNSPRHIDAADSSHALLDPPHVRDGVPLWRQRGGLRLSFELCRLSRLSVDARDSATAESCWAALLRRPSPWRWEAVQHRAANMLAGGDTARAESLIVRAGPRLQDVLDQAEQQLVLARLRVSRGDSARAMSSLGTLFARWPSLPPAGVGIGLFDSLSAPPRDSLARAFARRAAEVEVLNSARSAAVRRLRSIFRADTESTRRAASLDLGLRIAELLRLTRKFGEAFALIDTLERIAALDPVAAADSRVADVMLARARTLRDAGQSDVARREYARVAEATRDSTMLETAWWECGREAEEQGVWGEARAAYAHVDSLHRARAPVAVIRSGLLSFAQGDRVTARASFARDTTMASRFWWAVSVRDSDRARSDSALALIASAPGFRYYSVCSRESLGMKARPDAPRSAEDAAASAPPGSVRANIVRSEDDAVTLAHDLVTSGLLEDAAFLIDRWALGDEEAGAPPRRERYRARDLLDAAAIENACGRPAPAIRLARRAADELTRSDTSDSTATLALEATAFQFPPAFQAEIARAAVARHVGLESALLAALVWQESRFDSGAVSRTGARGLTQLMPPTASEMARQLRERAPPESLLNDPELDLRYGARYLRTLLDRFSGRVPLALAAYNAGVPAAERWAKLAHGAGDALLCELIAYAETQDYVKSILAARAAYREWKPALHGQLPTPIR